MSQPQTQNTVPEGPPSQPPQTGSRKRPLESVASDFLEGGWRLLGNVYEKKEYEFANVKEMPMNEPIGQ